MLGLGYLVKLVSITVSPLSLLYVNGILTTSKSSGGSRDAGPHRESTVSNKF